MRKLLLAVLLLVASVPALGQVPYRSFDLCNGYVGRTTSGACAAVETKATEVSYRYPTSRVYVDVTAVSGTSPSLTLRLFGVAGPFGVSFKVCESAAITATGRYTFTCDYLPESVIADALISGTTPNFTYAVYLVRQ